MSSLSSITFTGEILNTFVQSISWVKLLNSPAFIDPIFTKQSYLVMCSLASTDNSL